MVRVLPLFSDVSALLQIVWSPVNATSMPVLMRHRRQQQGDGVRSNAQWLTHALGGFGVRSTFLIVRISFSGLVQKRSGLSPGTGRVSSSAFSVFDVHDERAETAVERSAAVRKPKTFILI